MVNGFNLRSNFISHLWRPLDGWSPECLPTLPMLRAATPTAIFSLISVELDQLFIFSLLRLTAKSQVRGVPKKDTYSLSACSTWVYLT